MTAKNNIPAGYKDSAVGIIPQKWEVKALGEAYKLQGGYAFKSELFVDSGIPIVRISNLPMDSNTVDIADCVYYPYTEIIKEQFVIKQGMLLIAMSGATTGKTAIYRNADVAYLNQRVGMFCSKSDNITYNYLLQLVQSPLYSNALKPLLIAGAQPNIAPTDVENMKFPIPPMAEQRKIAEILGVWDEAIEKQSRLIEKLELRKRALMQRLLTGRTRLPGFTTPWQKCLYSDILKEVKRTMTWDDNEEYDLISVKRRSGGLFHRDRLLGKDIKTKNLRPAKCGDFLISKMQIVHGASGLVTEEFDEMKISGSYIALVARNGDMVDMKFINWYSKTPYFYHQTYVSSYGVHIEKMTFDLESFMSMNIMLPPFPEQKAIAEVLTAADNEIATHRKKLDAFRLQKRGLMQQLLTGKTRVKI